MKWHFAASLIAAILGLLTTVSTAMATDGESLVISNSPYRWHRSDLLVVQAFDRRSPPVISFPNPKKIVSCMFHGEPCPASMKMTLLPEPGMPRSRPFVLQWRDAAGPHVVRIRFLDRLKEVRVEGRSELKKHIFFATEGVIGAVSPNGELDYYRELEQGVIDFRPHIVGGKIYYTYGLIREVNTGVNSMTSHVVLDEKMKTVEVHERIVDSHEFLFLGRKHYLFTDYQTHARAKDGKCLLKQYLIEEKNGREVYTLSTDDLIARQILPDYGSTVKYNGKDCIQNGHLNGVTVIDPNRWLVSFGESAIFMWLKKERRAEWILGGEKDEFGLKPEQRTSLHHTPQWFPKTKSLLVFDNGHVQKKSRLLEYFLDTKNKKLRELKVTPLGDGFAIAGGSVEREGKVISAGLGYWESSDNDFGEMVDGKVTMTIRFCTSCDKGQTYRFYRGPFKK